MTNTVSETSAPARKRSWLSAVLPDLVVPVVLFYGLRAVGVAPLWALLIGGLPPAVRVGYGAIRRHRVEMLGLFVLFVLTINLLTSMITGDPRLLLIRGAWFSVVFGGWLLVSLVVAKRPFIYRVALDMTPARAPAMEAHWADTASFRQAWRRVTGIWGGGYLAIFVLVMVMAYTLPVDVVPVLDTALNVAAFFVFFRFTRRLLVREGTMARVNASLS